MKGRRWTKRRNGDGPPVRATGRPLRDRAIVYVLLSTGLRREELVNLDLDQLVPTTAEDLRQARQARSPACRARARPQRTVFLSADARAGAGRLPGAGAAQGCRRADHRPVPERRGDPGPLR